MLTFNLKSLYVPNTYNLFLFAVINTYYLIFVQDLESCSSCQAFFFRILFSIFFLSWRGRPHFSLFERGGEEGHRSLKLLETIISLECFISTLFGERVPWLKYDIEFAYLLDVGFMTQTHYNNSISVAFSLHLEHSNPTDIHVSFSVL